MVNTGVQTFNHRGIVIATVLFTVNLQIDDILDLVVVLRDFQTRTDTDIQKVMYADDREVFMLTVDHQDFAFCALLDVDFFTTHIGPV
jgi:hypothetical protein